MPITYNIYTATASQTTFAITFPYIESTHVKVQINGVENSSFSISGSNVVLDSGAAAGEKVKLYRQTPGRDADNKIMLVDFQDGSVLSEAELDKACQQLLYLAQEADETGASSLPVDWDGNYTAGSKRIKDLSADVIGDQDAATKQYVDGQTLYGGTVTLPQSWAYLGSDSGWSSLGSNNYQITLSSPTPNSANDDLYVVSINGLTQRPTTDFTVVESGGAFILKILGWTDKASSDVINIMNFGASRNWIDLPLKGASASDVALTVQRHTDGQSANLQEWVTEAATPVVLASVNEDGDASFVDVTATGNAAVTGTSTLTGNTTVGGTLGVTGASTLSGGVSGNLNLLTGSLQFAGTDMLRIRQIVTFTKESTPGDSYSAGAVQAGMTCVFTPQSASSKLLFIGGVTIFSDSVSGNYAADYAELSVYLTTGESSLGYSNSSSGTQVSPDFNLALTAHTADNANAFVNSVPMNMILNAGNTDERTYCVVHTRRTGNTNGIFFSTHFANASFEHEDLHIIEIG